MPLILTEQLTKIYTAGDIEVTALDGVDLTVAAGEFLAIMGPSGSGKSTLMNLLGCLDAPTSGSYFLDGQNVSELNRNRRADLRNAKVGFVFQGFNLLSRIDALANVEMPLIYGSVPASERRARASDALKLVGLEDRLHHLPTQLSGGQQQRAAIARAIVNRPELVLADEPTGNLDTATSGEIIEVFRRLNEQQGITFVLVTHDPEVAQLTDRQILIRDGKIQRDTRTTG